MKFIDDVVESNSDIASVTVYGNSTEGRALKIIKIGTPGTDKPALFLDGGKSIIIFSLIGKLKFKINNL